MSTAADPDGKVARVLELYDAFNARDVERLLSLYDDDVRILSFAAAVEGGDPYEGHAGVEAWYGNLVDTSDMVTPPEPLLPYGEGPREGRA